MWYWPGRRGCCFPYPQIHALAYPYPCSRSARSLPAVIAWYNGAHAAAERDMWEQMHSLPPAPPPACTLAMVAPMSDEGTATAALRPQELAVVSQEQRSSPSQKADCVQAGSEVYTLHYRRSHGHKHALHEQYKTLLITSVLRKLYEDCCSVASTAFTSSSQCSLAVLF